MRRLDDSLLTPIYLKTDEKMPWPKDAVFYLLSRDNLYLCRNHKYFRSSVPAPRWPTELADHQTQMRIYYPKIPRDQLEAICGFFDHVWWQDGAEAIALLAWDQAEKCVRTIVPKQIAAVSGTNYSRRFPLSVKYQLANTLPSHLHIFADIHSHCDMNAYASHVDVEDELGVTGLHIVVGQLQKEPPQFHVEAVVDEMRFKVELENVIEGYQQRTLDFPDQWIYQVTVVDYATYSKLDFDNVAEEQQDESLYWAGAEPQTSSPIAALPPPGEDLWDDEPPPPTDCVDPVDKHEETTKEDIQNEKDDQQT